MEFGDAYRQRSGWILSALSFAFFVFCMASVSLRDIVLFGLYAYALVLVFIQRKNVHEVISGREALVIGLLIIVPVVSSLLSPIHLVDIKYIHSMVGPFVLYLLLRSSGCRDGALKKAIIAGLIFGFTLSLAILAYRKSLPLEYRFDLPGVKSINQTAVYLACAIAVCAAADRHKIGGPAVIHGFILCLLAAGLATQSRTFILCLGIVVAWEIALRMRGATFRSKTLATVGALVTALAAA